MIDFAKVIDEDFGYQSRPTKQWCKAGAASFLLLDPELYQNI
jgi:hypothetical protein